jgi:molybdate transport system ATP-binding protein
MLEADCTKQLGTFAVTLQLTAEAGRTLVLVGESGAGKSTMLNLLAGLLQPDAGRIRLGGATYFDSDVGLALPAHARAVGYVFQDYALFPHLSVRENVAFGLRARGYPRGALRDRVRDVLAQLGLAGLAARLPAQLSGGQQQRTALARALVLQPDLLLLDEPMAALDAQTRRDVRAELRRILSTLSCVTLLVTHQPFEALALADRIAVVEQGRVVQLGAPQELLERPRSRAVAELMGLNFFRGRVVAADVDGLAEVETVGGIVRIACDPGDLEPLPEPLLIAVDPREITLHPAAPVGSAQNVFAGPIVQLVPEPPFGQRVRVLLGTQPPLVSEVTAHAVHVLGLREGVTVYASFKATAARAYR